MFTAAELRQSLHGVAMRDTDSGASGSEDDEDLFTFTVLNSGPGEGEVLESHPGKTCACRPAHSELFGQQAAPKETSHSSSDLHLRLSPVAHARSHLRPCTC